MAFNVIVADKSDDDGNAAGASFRENITAEQAKKVRELLQESGRDEAKFCTWMQIGSVEELPVGRYEYVVGEIAVANAKARAKAQEVA